GVFLPQVPIEQGWNLSQYLDHLCLKAGVPVGSYKKEGAVL
ncbi:MAG: AMMECR1 domain-containing protein, partial [Desulfovibrionaceae bacterium]|nr:AMMECR1 domain-containing protein [Desulfovibrionaceae bacterium]